MSLKKKKIKRGGGGASLCLFLLGRFDMLSFVEVLIRRPRYGQKR